MVGIQGRGTDSQCETQRTKLYTKGRYTGYVAIAHRRACTVTFKNSHPLFTSYFTLYQPPKDGSVQFFSIEVDTVEKFFSNSYNRSEVNTCMPTGNAFSALQC